MCGSLNININLQLGTWFHYFVAHSSLGLFVIIVDVGDSSVRIDHTACSHPPLSGVKLGGEALP